MASAIGLSNRGFNVIFFSAVGPPAKELIEAGVKVFVVGQKEILHDNNRLRAITQGLWNWRAARQLRQILKPLNPKNTVIHFHSWVKALSPSVIRASIVERFPVVCTLHDYFTACPNGGFYNFQENNLCMLKPLSLLCLKSNCDMRHYSHKLWRIIRHWIQGKWGMMPGLLKNYIYNSSFSLNLMAPYLPHDSHFFQIPPIIDIAHQTAVNPAKSKIFAMVGRLTREKGALIFAEAAQRAHVRSLFIGDGEAHEEIMRINPNAIITGWLPRSQVIEKLRSVRAIVHPTLGYETFGIAVLEAAGLGVPSIVAHRCAAMELVEEGVTGIAFKSCDIGDLSKKITALLNDDMAVSLGRNAYQKYWTEPFTLERHVDSLINAYHEILFSLPINSA